MTLPSNHIFSMSAMSRSAVQRLNQSLYVRKREPRTKPAPIYLWSAAWPSMAAKGTPLVPVEPEASSLLVILHYLLKNNITFMGGIDAGIDAPPSGNLLTPSGGWRRE